MDRSNVISLVSQTLTQDSIGQYVSSAEMLREVYCDVKSVSSQEYFNAGVDGVRPEYRFTMFEPDYDGEKIVVFNNQRYAVYRTYHGKNDMIDLYCERKAGI